MSETVSTIITMIISVIALFFSIISFFQSRSAVVRDFFHQGDSVEMKNDRKVIYDIDNAQLDKQETLAMLIKHEREVTNVISFFDFWSLMVKKLYLPRWTFQASSRFVAIKIFNIVRPYILHRRETQKEYACHFEWLVGKIR